MKKTLLLILAAALCTSLMAQYKAQKRYQIEDVTAKHVPACTGVGQEADVIPLLSNTILQSKTPGNLNYIGDTRYNAPTNNFARNTISFKANSPYAAAVWTTGDGETIPGTSEDHRGTGINYSYAEMDWEPAPNINERIESERTGFGSHAFTAEGEIVVAHNGLSGTDGGIVVNRRDKFGEGAWEEYLLQAPEYTIVGNKKSTSLMWPSIVSNGNILHLICVTEQLQTDTFGYKGFNTVPLYYRSSDGGKTWDIEAHDFMDEGMSEYEVEYTSADSYTIAVRGDHVVILYSYAYGYINYMESRDGGVSWIKKDVFGVYDWDFSANVNLEPRITPAGGGTIFIDDKDKVHVAFGGEIRFRTPDAGEDSYYHFVAESGIFYWNDDRAPFSFDEMRLWYHQEENSFYIDSANYDTYSGFFPPPSVLGYDQFYYWNVGPDIGTYAQFRRGGIAIYPRIYAFQNKVYLSYQSIIDYPLHYMSDQYAPTYFRGIFLTVSNDKGETWDVKNNTSWVSYHPNLFEYDFEDYKGPYFETDEDGEEYPVPPLLNEFDGKMIMATENAFPTMSVNASNQMLILQWYENGYFPFHLQGTGFQNTIIHVHTFSKYLWEYPGYNNIQLVYRGEQSVSEPKTTINMNIYPNPANGTTMVDIADANGPYTLTVTNIMGQVVYSMNGHESTVGLNVANYPAGVYIVNVRTANAISSQKLIVQ